MTRSPLHYLAQPMLVLAGSFLLMAVPFGIYCDFAADPHYTLILSTPFLIHALLTSATFLSINVGIACLADHRGPTGRPLGRWASVSGLVASTVGFFLEANHAFIQPAIVVAAPSVMAAAPTGLLAIGVFGGDLVVLIGLAAFGISVFRARLWPRPAAGLFVAGVLAMPFGSLGSLLIGVGLAWAGLSGLRARSAVPGASATAQSLSM